MNRKLRFWTSKEEEILKKMAVEGATVFEIANSIDRSPMAVILRTRALSGLERPDSKQRMSDNYYDPTKTIREVATESWNKWTKADNDLLKKRFYDGYNIFQIAEQLNRTPTAIIRQIEKLYSMPGGMTELFERAKLLLGKKRIVT